MPGMQIKVLDKAIRVVELLAQSNRGVRLKDVIAAVALNKTTALRILRALESSQRWRWCFCARESCDVVGELLPPQLRALSGGAAGSRETSRCDR